VSLKYVQMWKLL